MKSTYAFVRRAAALGALVFAMGCTGSGTDTPAGFAPLSTRQGILADARVVVSGKWVVFQADEATTGKGAGTDLNGDTVKDDQVAVVVNMVTEKRKVLGVAALDFAIVGNEVYLEVDETLDNFDWNNDATVSGVVLCHYPTTGTGNSSPNAPDVEYVADMEDESNQDLVEVDGRLYFTRSDSTVLANGEMTLAYIDPADPVTVVTVLSNDAAHTHKPRILRAEEGLLFLYQDEDVAVENRDINNDGVADDGFVLSLVDATKPAAKMRSTKLALRDDEAPVRARQVATHDWVVGFLVNEAAQGTAVTGFNDPSLFGPGWLPDNCPNYADDDTDDDVLHFLLFADWDSAPLANPPTNTGITGRDQVVCTSAVVATITDEADEEGATCDMNDDGDKTDEIVRWVKIATPGLPVHSDVFLVAVDDSTPGGASGLTDLNGYLLAVIDESEDDADYDGSTNDNKLLCWIDPVTPGDGWVADHASSQTSELYFGATWLGEGRPHDFARVAFKESVLAQNEPQADSVFGNGDGDSTDALPGIAVFQNPTDLDFFWPRVATSAANAGVCVFGDRLFLRVNEQKDDKDWNLDGDKDDTLVARTALNGANFFSLGVANDIADLPSVFGGGSEGVAWIATESDAKVDFDDDGDKTDLVLRWCRIDG